MASTDGNKLALLLQAIRVSSVKCARVHLHAPGGVRIPQGRFPQFFIVLEGSVMLSSAQLGALEPMVEGDFVLLPKSRSHALASSPSAPLTDTKYFATGAAAGPEFGSKEPVDVRVGSGVRKSAEILVGTFPDAELGSNPLFASLPGVTRRRAFQGADEIAALFVGPGASEIIRRFVDLQVGQLLREYALTSPLLASLGKQSIASARVSAARTLIVGEPEREWSVGQLAAEVGMSRSAFAAAFKHATRRTPMSYVTEVRLLRAAALMRSSDDSLMSIARRAGYRREAAFARAFKRAIGMAPHRYRAKEASSAQKAEALMPWDPFL